MPATVIAAYADPEVTGAPDAVVRTSDGMSNPLTSEKSSGTPPIVIATPFATVPLLGGFWMNTEFVTASITYCVVTPPVSG
jgi:hypothetical protein